MSIEAPAPTASQTAIDEFMTAIITVYGEQIGCSIYHEVQRQISEIGDIDLSAILASISDLETKLNIVDTILDGDNTDVQSTAQNIIGMIEVLTGQIGDMSTLYGGHTTLVTAINALKTQLDSGAYDGQDGTNGADGADGSVGQDGASAYELWLQAGNSGDTNVFLASLKGADGADGQNGADGADGVDGASAYDIWKAQGNTGSVQDFIDSLQGANGSNGASAYELWLADGNSGSVQVFLESLKGANGANGASAYELWLADGNSGSVQVFLESLKGADGTNGVDGVDGADGADGADGQNGADGADGANGASAYEIWLAAGNSGSVQVYLDSLKGADGEDCGCDGKLDIEAVTSVTVRAEDFRTLLATSISTGIAAARDGVCTATSIPAAGGVGEEM